MTTESVLIVGCTASERSALAEALAEGGRTVQQSQDGDIAPGLLSRFAPDLMLVDAVLPDGDGCEWLRRVRARLPGVEALVLVNEASLEAFTRAGDAGAFDVLQRPIDLSELRRAVAEVFAARRARSAKGNRELRRIEPPDSPQLVGRSRGMVAVYRQMAAAARSSAGVLIIGETGTGKELIARQIHGQSKRPGKFVPVNLASVLPTLAESELFGHVRGAFTGADRDRKGYFERAGGGTVFLDEIGEATPDLQSKLLRVLQERVFLPVGGDAEVETHARVLAATNRDLGKMVREKAFRQDLMCRLAVLVIQVPPLRDRMDDLVALVEYLIARATRGTGRGAPRIASDAWAVMQAHRWPGNVRELANCLERASVSCKGGVIRPTDLDLDLLDSAADRGPTVSRPSGGDRGSKAGDRTVWSDFPGPLPTLDDAEREHISEALRRHRNNLAAAARVLGVARSTLQSRMKVLGIRVSELDGA